jgi:hypothetical protein
MLYKVPTEALQIFRDLGIIIVCISFYIYLSSVLGNMYTCRLKTTTCCCRLQYKRTILIARLLLIVKIPLNKKNNTDLLALSFFAIMPRSMCYWYCFHQVALSEWNLTNMEVRQHGWPSKFLCCQLCTFWSCHAYNRFGVSIDNLFC